MGRAAGRAHARRPPRTPQAPPADSPQGRELGLDDRDIPSGIPHLEQHKTIPGKAAVPEAPPVFRGDMQHGVPAGPDDNFVKPADKLERGHQARKHGSQPVHYEMPPAEPDPLPVYLVEKREKVPVRREAIIDSITVAAQGGEPTRICSEDPDRVQIQLLNEDPVNIIRFAATQAELSSGTGAALPAVTNSYTRLRTQGELWAVVAAPATARLSRIIETEIETAAR
jgi:hypothetical protein